MTHLKWWYRWKLIFSYFICYIGKEIYFAFWSIQFISWWLLFFETMSCITQAAHEHVHDLELFILPFLLPKFWNYRLGPSCPTIITILISTYLKNSYSHSILYNYYPSLYFPSIPNNFNCLASWKLLFIRLPYVWENI